MNKLPYYPYDIDKDGFTQSLLTAWMKCPSMARAKINGLYRPGSGGKAITFGSVFHEYMDVMLNEYKNGSFASPEQCEDASWMNVIEAHVKKAFAEEYIKADAQGKDVFIEQYAMCKVVVPEYFLYWQEDFFGNTKKEWDEIEGEFNVQVSGGRFRGKRDGVYHKAESITKMLFETKTKSRFNDDVLSMIIPRDFQVRSYMLAWWLEHGVHLGGVLYNIIRRPQLRQTNKEDQNQFMERIRSDIKKRPDFYFVRHNVSISMKEIEDFSKKFAKLTLAFAEWVKQNPDEDAEHIHECNSIFGACSFLEYCASKKQNESTLDVKTKLFSELG